MSDKFVRFMCHMGWKKPCIMLLLVIIVFSVIPCAGQCANAAYISGDAAVTLLQTEGVLAGYPGSKLRLDQSVTAGEYMALLQRALKVEPKDTAHYSTGTNLIQPTFWDWSYYWFRQTGTKWSAAKRWIRTAWFDYMYVHRWGKPWKIEQTDWQYAFLRNAYLDGTIDLTFSPRSHLSGLTAVSLLLSASGFGDESASLSGQIKDATPEDTLRIICIQHGLLDDMFLKTSVVTRREAAMMVAAVLDCRLNK